MRCSSNYQERSQKFEKTFKKADVEFKSSKKENKPKEEKIKSLGITIKDNEQSDGVIVTKVVNALDDMFTDAPDIVLIVVATHMGYVADTLTAGKNLIKTTRLIEVCRVQGKASRRVAGHGA